MVGMSSVSRPPKRSHQFANSQLTIKNNFTYVCSVRKQCHSKNTHNTKHTQPLILTTCTMYILMEV